MGAGSTAGAGLLKFIRAGHCPQSTDIQAAAIWGVAATSGALWLIQAVHTMVARILHDDYWRFIDSFSYGIFTFAATKESGILVSNSEDGKNSTRQ